MKKKGQSGMNAAVLVAIIGALLIIFVLFSSNEERAKFLNETNTKKSTSTTNGIGRTILLLEHPGTLIHLTKNEIDHELPSINLYSTTESRILKSIESLYVKNSVFDKQEKQVSFSVENPKSISNILLSFNPLVSKGNLIIVLNGNEVYNNGVSSMIAEPIKIPNELLMQDNLLVFRVSGVGIKFWATNEYSLEKIKVTGDNIDTSTQTSELVFLVNREEEANLEKATLKFVPECNIGDAGKLDIFVNTYHIYSSVPDCGVLYPLEFSYAYLTEGENRVMFNSQKGSYLIDRLSVNTKLRETPSYVYSFELTKDQFEDVTSKKFDVNLSISFFDDFEEKAADIYINAQRTSMPRTKESQFSRNINSYIERGSNTLKIVPRTTLEIDDLKVELVESKD